METTINRQSTYQIEGKFLGFLPNSEGKLKHIQVQVEERIISIKLAKELRETLGRKLVEGDRLSIALEQTNLGGINRLKLKTDQVTILTPNNKALVLETPSSKTKQTQKGKILLCRKSSCAKRGGKQLYRALTETLNQLGLQDRVKIELTGCQKQCKKAPSLVVMPGKVKHAYVNPNDLISLLKTRYL